MIARIRAWVRFDAERVVMVANALAGWSGAPLPVYDFSALEECREQDAEEADDLMEAAEPAIGITVGG